MDNRLLIKEKSLLPEVPLQSISNIYLIINNLNNNKYIGSTNGVLCNVSSDAKKTFKKHPIIVNNIQYKSFNRVAKELNILSQSVLNRTNSNIFPEWNYRGQ